MAKQDKTKIASPDEENSLGVLALAGVVISSMIGGGIYSLPQNMAAGASVGAVILAWIITGIGVYFILFCKKEILKQLDNQKVYKI